MNIEHPTSNIQRRIWFVSSKRSAFFGPSAKSNRSTFSVQCSMLDFRTSDFCLPSSGFGLYHSALPSPDASIMLDSLRKKERIMFSTHSPIITSRNGVIDPDSVLNISIPKIKIIPDIWPDSINTPWDVASGAG